MQERSAEQVRTIALHKPFGEAVCLSSAFEHTRGRLVVTSPEYVQVDPHDLSKLLEAIDDGPTSVDQLVDRLGIGAGEIYVRLGELSAGGHVIHDGARVRRA